MRALVLVLEIGWLDIVLGVGVFLLKILRKAAEKIQDFHRFVRYI